MRKIITTLIAVAGFMAFVHAHAEDSHSNSVNTQAGTSAPATDHKTKTTHSITKESTTDIKDAGAAKPKKKTKGIRETHQSTESKTTTQDEDHPKDH